MSAAIKNSNDYVCPYCGEPATAVTNTASYDSYITRKRLCLICGEVHQTVETRIDLMEVLNFAHAITKKMEAETISQTA